MYVHSIDSNKRFPEREGKTKANSLLESLQRHQTHNMYIVGSVKRFSVEINI